MLAVPHLPSQLHGTQNDTSWPMPVMKKTNMIEIEVWDFLRYTGFQMKILLLGLQEVPEINKLPPNI